MFTKTILFILSAIIIYLILQNGYLISAISQIKNTTFYISLREYENNEKFNNAIKCMPTYKDIDTLYDDKNSYSFYIAGHTYGNSSKPDNKGLYPKFYEKLNTLNNSKAIDFIVLTGDVVQNSTIKSWNIVKKQLQDLGMRTYISPGSHDVGHGKDNAKRDIFKSMFGDTYFYFYHKNDLFIILDPNLDNGNISGRQLKFLNDLLETKEKVNNIFVFSHQVIWASNFRDLISPNNSYETETNFWPIIAPLFDIQKEQIYFIAGDVGDKINGSELFCIENNNIKYIASGMGAGKRDNYLTVQITGGNVSITPVLMP